MPTRRLSLSKFVPAIVRQSHGLQRFMLLLGFAIIAAFVFIAIFAPWLAPYGFNADRSGGVLFGTQQAPSADHWFGTTVGGTDVSSTAPGPRSRSSSWRSCCRA